MDVLPNRVMCHDSSQEDHDKRLPMFRLDTYSRHCSHTCRTRASEGEAEFLRSQPNPRQSHMLLAQAGPDLGLFLRHREFGMGTPQGGLKNSLRWPILRSSTCTSFGN